MLKELRGEAFWFGGVAADVVTVTLGHPPSLDVCAAGRQACNVCNLQWPEILRSGPIHDRIFASIGDEGRDRCVLGLQRRRLQSCGLRLRGSSVFERGIARSNPPSPVSWTEVKVPCIRCIDISGEVETGVEDVIDLDGVSLLSRRNLKGLQGSETHCMSLVYLPRAWLAPTVTDGVLGSWW